MQNKIQLMFFLLRIQGRSWRWKRWGCTPKGAPHPPLQENINVQPSKPGQHSGDRSHASVTRQLVHRPPLPILQASSRVWPQWCGPSRPMKRPSTTEESKGPLYTCSKALEEEVGVWPNLMDLFIWTQFRFTYMTTPKIIIWYYTYQRLDEP